MFRSFPCVLLAQLFQIDEVDERSLLALTLAAQIFFVGAMTKGSVTPRRRADTLLKLRSAGSPKNFEDTLARLRFAVAKMLSSTRVARYGPPEAVPEESGSIIMSSDYSGMGTAEFAAGELEVQN